MKTMFWIAIILCICAGCGRKSKEELYTEGLRLLNASNAGGAVVLFRNALEKDENYLDARFQLAKTYLTLGKLEQAEKEFLKVIKQNPSRDEVLPELAAVYNSSKKPEQAFKLGEQYLTKHPGSVEGLEILGVSCAVSGKYEDAEHYLLQATIADPTRTKTRIELATVYASGGKQQKAKSLLKKVLQTDKQNIRAFYLLAALEKAGGNSDKSLDIYRKILITNPMDTVAAYKSGLIYIEKGELDKAEKEADALVKNFSRHSDGYRLKGLVSFHRKNYTDAMMNLQNSIKIEPNLEAFHFLGLCYYNRGELESALSQFRKILDNIPDSRQALLMTGTILLAQKRVDDAISEIQKVLKKDDGDAIGHNLLGNAYMFQGMFDEGLREYNLATNIDPKIVDAYLKKGYFYFSRGKNSEGESELVTAVKAVPDSLSSRVILASYHQRKGKHDKALSVLQAGLSGNKSDALLYNSIAAVLFSENRLDEGLKSIQKAKDIDPVFPGSYHNLVTIYAATGKYDKAIEEYKILLRNDSKNIRAMLGIAALYEIKGQDRESLYHYKMAAEISKPEGFIALASYYQRKSENAKALTTLEEAIKIDSHNIAVLEVKGRLLISDKKYKEALTTFDEIELINFEAGVALKIVAYLSMKDTAKAVEQACKIIEKYPGSARGYMILASIFESQKDYARAISEAKNAIRVEGNNLKAMLYLGSLLEIGKDYNQAMSLYSEALRKKPEFFPAIFAQGSLLDLTGKKKEAIAKYKMVLERSDNYVPALNNLAYLSAAGYGTREEALRLAISAYKLEPWNAGVMDTLGFALIKNNRLEDAKKILEKASAALSNNPTVHYHLALAYKESGDKVNASRVVKKALSLGEFPDSGSAAQLETELKK